MAIPAHAPSGGIIASFEVQRNRRSVSEILACLMGKGFLSKPVWARSETLVHQEETFGNQEWGWFDERGWAAGRAI